MKQPLAIVGASARAAAASAVRAGFQPVSADLFADADLRRIATATRVVPYPEGLLDWLRTIEPAAWMYTGALENHSDLVDEMAWIAPLWGNPGDVLTRVRSPWELARALADGGFLFPETRKSADLLPQDGSWLVKTYRGASGSGVRLLAEREKIEDERKGSRSTDRFTDDVSPCVFQRRMVGMPAAAVLVAADGHATLLGLTRQLIGVAWLGSRGFQYAGSIGPLPLSEKAQATIQSVGNWLAERFELVGLFGIDFLLAGDEVWTLEVNPRYTASVEIIERTSGVQSLALHAAACRGTPSTEQAESFAHFSPPAPSAVCAGKAILFARHAVTITPSFAEWSLAEAARTPWPLLADVSPGGTHVEAGRPLLTMFAEGATPDEVEHQLRRRAAEIERKLVSPA